MFLCGGGIEKVASAQGEIPAPPPSFYVLDEAGVLSPQAEEYIISVSRSLEQSTRAQVVVVTLRDGRGRTVEDLGLSILRGWGVGDRQLNNGVVLLVIPAERRSRIEVGYGLEGALPDGKTGRIQDEYMLPFFRQGNYEQGILNGYAVLVQEVAREYGVALDLRGFEASRPAVPATGGGLSPGEVFLLVLGIMVLYVIDRRFLNGLLFGLLLSMLMRGGGWRGGGPGGGGWTSGGGGSGGGGGSSRSW